MHKNLHMMTILIFKILLAFAPQVSATAEQTM